MSACGLVTVRRHRNRWQARCSDCRWRESHPTQPAALAAAHAHVTPGVDLELVTQEAAQS